MMLLAVVLGAFGAHALKKVITPEGLNSFQTGVRYQMFHAIALMIFALNVFEGFSHRQFVATLFKVGIILFSFSIYFLTLAKIVDLGTMTKVLRPITPLGGLSLISAWILVVISLVKWEK